MILPSLFFFLIEKHKTSTRRTASDRPKKVRAKTEKRPFKIGELVESMKSDTDGTWFAGRVLDLEDDPHDHINPKSVQIGRAHV